jgi:hypothetical protein
MVAQGSSELSTYVNGTTKRNQIRRAIHIRSTVGTRSDTRTTVFCNFWAANRYSALLAVINRLMTAYS